jgi:uncharacterized membrane protein
MQNKKFTILRKITEIIQVNNHNFLLLLTLKPMGFGFVHQLFCF